MQSMHSWFPADHCDATLEAAGILIFCMLCRQMMATTMHTIYLRYHAQVGSVGSDRVGRVGGNMLPSQVVDFMVVLINIFNFSPVDKRWLKPN